MRRLISILLGTTLLCAPSAQAVTLKEALAAAYETNPEIMASRAQLDAIGESYNQADAQNDLRLDLEGSYGASRRLRSTLFSNRTAQEEDVGGELGVSLTKPLYQGGRVKALKKQSAADIEAAKQTLRRTQQKVFLETTNAYIDAVFDEDVLELQQKHLGILEDMKNLVKSREEIGIGTETDIWRINSRHSAVKGDITRAETQLAVSQTVFRQVTGKQATNMHWNRSLSVPSSVDAAVEMARNNNPQLFEAKSREDSAAAAIDVAKSATKPTLAIVGNSFITDERLTDLHDVDGVTLGLNFKMPILGNGANNSRVRAAKHELASRQFQTAMVERSIRSGIEQAWVQYNGSKSVRDSVAKRMENAEKTYKNIQIEFDLGTRTIFDVVESEQDYLNSQVEYLQSRRDAEQAAAYLLAAMGMVDTIPHVQQVMPSGPDQIGDKEYAALTATDSPAELSRGIPIDSKIVSLVKTPSPMIAQKIMPAQSVAAKTVPPMIAAPVSTPSLKIAAPVHRPMLRSGTVPQTMVVPTVKSGPILVKPTPVISTAAPKVVRSAPRVSSPAPVIATPAPVTVPKEKIFASVAKTDSPADLGRSIRTAPMPVKQVTTTSRPQVASRTILRAPVQASVSQPVSRAKIFASVSSHDTPADLGRKISASNYRPDPVIRARTIAPRPVASNMRAVRLKHVLD